MSEYTKDAPFEFEGWRLWRDEGGSLRYIVRTSTSTDRATAYHAFIEAESTGWRWTNDDHTEARNGRWSARRGDRAGTWSIHLDDFLGRGQASDELVVVSQIFAARVRDDFLAWHAAAYSPQPEEPKGFGAVVEVGGKHYVHVPEYEGDTYPWFHHPEHDWLSWSNLTERGHVTVLSAGVES